LQRNGTYHDAVEKLHPEILPVDIKPHVRLVVASLVNEGVIIKRAAWLSPDLSEANHLEARILWHNRKLGNDLADKVKAGKKHEMLFDGFNHDPLLLR